MAELEQSNIDTEENLKRALYACTSALKDALENDELSVRKAAMALSLASEALAKDKMKQKRAVTIDEAFSMNAQLARGDGKPALNGER